ncbi:MAG: hypothetical protein ABIN67_09670 [Ferruginibacter sp.]
MKFGNWKLTGTTIEYSGDGSNSFVIERESLFETIQGEDGDEPLYKWIVLATEEEWLTEDELYDLNFAFVFAAGASPENFSYDLLDRTLDYQFDTLDEEEESEPDNPVSKF